MRWGSKIGSLMVTFYPPNPTHPVSLITWRCPTSSQHLNLTRQYIALPPLPNNYNLNYGQLGWATVRTVNYRCYPNEQPAFPQNLPPILSNSLTTRSRLKFRNNQLANMQLKLPYLASGSLWIFGSCNHQHPTSIALTLQRIGLFTPWVVSILTC
jgi:hypothetical protein